MTSMSTSNTPIPTSHKKRMSMTKSVLISIGIALLAALIVLRLYLSTWLLGYVNDVLAHVPGYQGSIESINIDLYRGAYRMNKLTLNKMNGKIPVPLIVIDVTDLSLEWSALLHGRIVSSATLVHPTINFAVKNDAKQTGENVDWTKPIKALAPIDINHVRIEDGAVTYQDFSSTPQVNIYINNMDGDISNLRNVTDPNQPLPSEVHIHGGSIGNGTLDIKGRMNILKPVPDMNLLMALEKVNLPAINNYTDAYGAFSFQSGTFNLYSQLKVKNNNVSGYVKPIVTNLSVDITKKANPLEVIWSTLVAGILKIFTNLSHDQFATRIDLEGNIDNINADTWSAIGGILRNAFISALDKGFEQTGKQDLVQPDKPTPQLPAYESVPEPAEKPAQ